MRMKKKPLALWIFTGFGIRYCGRHAVDEPAGHCGNVHQALWNPVSEPAEIHRSPIVLFSIMNGVISMKDIKKVGSIGGKTVIYYMCTYLFCGHPGTCNSRIMVQKGISGAVHQLSGVYGSRNT